MGGHGWQAVPSLLDEVIDQVSSVAKDAREVLDAWWEDAQYEADKGFAKLMAQHPELYADLRRAWRKTRKAVDGWLK